MSDENKIEAKYYTKLKNGVARCDTCPRGCVIKPGGKGYCLNRANENGTLISAQYGEVAAAHLDPIEKKPLYHFMPGSRIFSIGTIGCNLGCKFCQNWQLSRGKSYTDTYTPEQLIQAAIEHNSIGIAYTYNEPLIWYEFVLDCSKAAKAAGLKNVFVTNGTLNPAPFDELLPFVDAFNIDLKGDAGFYKTMTDSTLEPVLRNIRKAAKTTHVEVTTLLVSGENDSPGQIAEIVDFVASIDRKIPLHFSRYFPNYKLRNAPTPHESMETAYRIGKAKLDFVFLGNVGGSTANDTVCPKCGTMNVSRSGYMTEVISLDGNGGCGNCGYDLKIVES